MSPLDSPMEETYIIVVATTQGPITERHPSYEQALRRINALPSEILLSAPLLFKELPDGSQRLVRTDGKPLQVHRLPDDEPPAGGEVLPLAQEDLLGELKPHREPSPDWDLDEEPLPLGDFPPPDP